MVIKYVNLKNEMKVLKKHFSQCYLEIRKISRLQL